MIGFDELQDPNLVDIWLQAERSQKISELLERRRYVSLTSCGICGKELIEDIYQTIAPAADGPEVDIDRIFTCLDQLDEKQQFYETTRCSHAALVLDAGARTIAFAEDVGRHNALDKVIGKAFAERRLGLDAFEGGGSKASIVVLSSRNSYELIQKAARARVPIMISKSRPTALAVEMGKALNMTLAFPDKKDLVIVCNDHRIKR